MTVTVTVDLAGPIPVYEQIRAQIAGAIGAGDLQPGERLPTVRGLAADLGIAVNTVVRAYAELESLGLVRSGRRAGTVVQEITRPPVPERVVAAVNALAAAAVAAGMTDQAVHDMVRSAIMRARERAVGTTPLDPADTAADSTPAAAVRTRVPSVP